MPLIKRSVEPIELSRSALAPGVRNELECVTNNTLANVIRQLSSLSLHAENMFSELFADASSFFERANGLQERIDRLKVKVTQLDSTVEEVSLQDINTRKPFKSSIIKDAQVVNITSRPFAIKQTYLKCDAPPPLSKLNAYREDGKDSMKFYTDPTYFFELWCHEMTKDTEMQKKELKQRRRNKVSRRANHHPPSSSNSLPPSSTPHSTQASTASSNTTSTNATASSLNDGAVTMRPKQGQRQHPQKIREIKSKKDEYARMAKGKEFIPESQLQQMAAEEGRSPSRPNSLELQNANFLAQQGYVQGGQYPPGYGQPGYQYTNGPDGPQYDMDQYNHTEYQRQGYGDGRQEVIGSPHQTPTKRGSTKAPSNVSSPRPTAAPPPPPGMGGKDGSPMDSRAGSASRESLPPPPPPPPADGPQMLHNNRGTPPFSPNKTHSMQMNYQRHDSPIRQQTHSPSPQHANHTKSSTPDSIDLPPPPPPPPLSQTPDTPGSMSSMPPPPPTPPPPELHDGSHHDPHHAPPPPPPPPPPPNMMMNGTSKQNGPVPNGGIPSAMALAAVNLHPVADNISLTSNASSAASADKGRGKDPADDERSDLLAAIRTGIQLRKVEERRVKEEQKKHPPSGLDVQSIMEAAFEMRRKALEANDSDEEEEGADSDVVWDSGED